MINGPGEKIVRDPRLTSNPTNHPSCICQRGQNCAISRAHFETRKCYVTPGFGVSGGVLSFMSTCRARACLQGLGCQGGCYRSCQLDAHAHATSRQGLQPGLGCQGGCYRSCQLDAHAHATSRQGLGCQGGCYRSCQLAAHAHATSRQGRCNVTVKIGHSM